MAYRTMLHKFATLNSGIQARHNPFNGVYINCYGAEYETLNGVLNECFLHFLLRGTPKVR